MFSGDRRSAGWTARLRCGGVERLQESDAAVLRVRQEIPRSHETVPEEKQGEPRATVSIQSRVLMF